MENKDLKYRRVLDKLRNTEPLLDDAEGLTGRILQKIGQMPQTTVSAGRIRVMRLSGILSGVAASALICLFAYETLKYPASPVVNDPVTAWATPVDKTYPNKAGAKEKEKFIENAFKNKKLQQERKEQLYASLLARK